MRRIIYIIVVALVSISSFSQDSQSIFPNIIPNSPNAASLGYFGSVPVGHYTGAAEITVPIHNIDFEGKSIPITMSYHSSGIRVEQEASWVGLGWNLFVGGSIVKSVNGLDDFNQGGYVVTTAPFPHSNDRNNPDPAYLKQESYLYNDVYYGNTDSEPDKFYYNFAGISGYLFFERQNAPADHNYTAVTNSKDQYLSVTYNKMNKRWIIRDGNGFTYYFGTYETTHTYTSLSTYYMSLENYSFDYNYADLKQSDTAWMIDSIVAPNKNKITFTYEFDNIRTPVTLRESFSGRTDLVGTFGQTSIMPKQSYKYYLFSTSDIRQARLKEIRWDNRYTMIFNSSERLDLKGIDKNKPKKLHQININYEKYFDFTYSYSGNISKPETCRLMLTSVKSNDYKYDFTYNSKFTLPAKNSFQIDYWGYYNGHLPLEPSYINPNQMPLSPTWTGASLDGKAIVFSGKNYFSDVERMQTGILTKVKYPTGATAELFYSPHKYEPAHYFYHTEERILGAVGSGRPDNPNPYSDSRPFTITTEQKVYTHVGWNKFDRNAMPASFSIELYKLNANSKYEFYTSLGSYDCVETGSRSRGPGSKLEAGTYIIRLLNYPSPDEWRMSARVCESYEVATKIDYGAGLKVDEIIMKNSSNQSIMKITKFVYEKNNRTSGILLNGELILNNSTIIGNWNMPGTAYGEAHYTNTGTDFLKKYSTGTQVGYSYVEEITTDLEKNNYGKTAYYFYNNANATPIPMYPLFPSRVDIRNGLLLKTEIYNSSNALVKSINNEYHYKRSKYIKGFQPIKTPEQFVLNLYEGVYQVKFYYVSQETAYLVKTTVDEYLNHSLSYFETYKYNSNMLVSEKATFNSQGILKKELVKYPTDYTDATSVEMTKNHLVNLPVESIKMKDDNYVIGAQKTSFKKFSNNLYLPDKEYILNTTKPLLINSYSNNYEPVLEYRRYNKYGRIENIYYNDMEYVYLWAYYGTKPIAEIKNASIIDVEAAAKEVFSVKSIEELASLKFYSEIGLTKLREHSKLGKAHVRTLKYDRNGLLGGNYGISGYDEMYEYKYLRLKTIDGPNGRTKGITYKFKNY